MAGCGQETIKDSDVVATVGKTEIKGKYSKVYFARYQQAMYETYYSSMLGENYVDDKSRRRYDL